MVPFGPVHSEQDMPIRATGEQIQPPRGEFKIVDVLITQQPVEAVDRTVQPGPQPAGQRRGDGERASLTSGGDGGDDQTQRLRRAL